MAPQDNSVIIHVEPPDFSKEERVFLAGKPSINGALRTLIGRRVSRTTLYRWIDDGCPSGGARVRLPTVMEGSRRVSSREALERFVDEVRRLAENTHEGR